MFGAFLIHNGQSYASRGALTGCLRYYGTYIRRTKVEREGVFWI
jgi:hypothetical protein